MVENIFCPITMLFKGRPCKKKCGYESVIIHYQETFFTVGSLAARSVIMYICADRQMERAGIGAKRSNVECMTLCRMSFTGNLSTKTSVSPSRSTKLAVSIQDTECLTEYITVPVSEVYNIIASTKTMKSKS